MNNPSLRLRCEPLFPDNTMISDEFYRENVGIIIPLGSRMAAADKDLKAMQQIIDYLHESPPHFTSLRFTDSEGKEPAYLRVSPRHERQDERVWNKIYSMWPRVLLNLIGDSNKCYISGWSLLPERVSDYLPEDYYGEILHRTSDSDVQVLLEGTQSFIEVGLNQLRKGIMHPNIWTYGMWGYIINEKHNIKMREWTSLKTCDYELVNEFFEAMCSVFWVKYELQGIWIMSHKMDWTSIYQRVDVEGINKILVAE